MNSPDHNCRAVDELAIRNLVARVSQLTDYGEIDDYLDLYTDDGVWELPVPNVQAGVAATRRQGRDAIRDGVLERRHAGVQGPGTHTMHVVSTTVVEFREEEVAVASSYFRYYSATNTAPVLRSVGHYEDLVRRTPDGWKLARRRLTTGGPPPGGWRPSPDPGAT